MLINFETNPFANPTRWVQLSARRNDAGNLMAQQISELEREFVLAYQTRHGAPIREFAQMDTGQYRINGIIFSETQVNMMLETLKEEIMTQHKIGLVKRLIRYLGGKRD